ncbi:hypothetical protein PSET11_00912 [Arthrobacter ulcerisalmonis]|uniref:Uncharacterized protein n=1 Tax=Arthrobacter ulcerisalmonis TaxID=2483813 RepID=A0A3P5WFA1_9MICC|nr:hypothetical protein [Arthrobacter ulcerisalmonis]VDC22263.1 hypothetical protein PSET11_00912 [Arthrobacter ulcerisalmonis]
MSAQYSVQATPAAQEAGAVALAVASLPESFTPGAAGADVIVLAGTAGWTTAAQQAVDAGARGVVVVNPAAEDTAALRVAARAAGSAIVLDQRWAANPAVRHAEHAVRSAASRLALIDSVAMAPVGTDLDRLLTDHVAAVVRITGPLADLRLLHRGAHGYSASARFGNGAPVALQGIVSAARPAHVTLSVLTDDGGVSVTLPDPVAAWPGTVTVTGPQGAVLLPTLYESAHRTTWRRLKEHLDSRSTPPDLDRFAQLTQLLSGVS